MRCASRNALITLAGLVGSAGLKNIFLLVTGVEPNDRVAYTLFFNVRGTVRGCVATGMPRQKMADKRENGIKPQKMADYGVVRWERPMPVSFDYFAFRIAARGICRINSNKRQR